MVLVGLGAVAFVWTSALVHLSEEKAQTEQAALQNAANLTRAFEEHIVRAIKTVDQTLLFVRAAYQTDPKHLNIMQWSQDNPLLADLLLQVSLVDRNGNRILSSIGKNVPPANLRDRDYFQFYRHSTKDELFIGRPVVGRASGQWSIPLTRLLLAPDDAVAGVVVASLNPAYLERFYDSVDVGKSGAIVLVGTDGIVRARRAAADEHIIGQSLVGSPLMQHVAEAPVGSFRSAGVIDGVVRLFAYRKVRELPLVVEVGLAENEVLANYRRDRDLSLTTATLLSVLLLAGTALMVRRQIRLQHMREALSESERKYRSVVDNLNEVVFRTDVEGRLTFLNPIWTKLTGFPVADSLGRSLFGYVEPNDRPLYQWHVDEIIQGRAEGSPQDMRFLGKDGALCWFELDARAVRQEDGKIVGLYGTLNDITPRKVMELELQHSREGLDRAQHVAQVGSFDHDLVANRVEWSDELYRIFGLDPGKGGGSLELALSRVHPDDREKFVTFREEALQGARSFALDFRIIRPDGTERILHRESDVITSTAGLPIRLFGTFQDITERKQVEEALREARDAADRSARAKSEFLAMMSHEIRSPMNGVVGLIDLLRQTALDAEQQQMLDMAHDSAISLLAVLNDILDFSKIEAGKITIAPEPVELSRFIPSICETQAHSASQKGLIFENRIEPEVPDRIQVDPVRLRQILVNLLSNAIKFTAQGSVRLVVARHGDVECEPTLAFTVADTGIGMSAAVISRLFKPFSQADASTTRDFGGTGLGLSISQRLAGLLGGRLEVTSEPGVGSAFTLLLPVVLAAPASASAPADADRRDGEPDFGGRRVLVAEDLPTNRWLIVRQLRKLGLAADAVENGQAALAALAAQHYDLLITDFHMPKMDGMALTARIRESEAQSGVARLPILGLTADVTADSRERCMAAGMDWIVSKPTDLHGLGEALRRLLLPHSGGAAAPAAEAGPGAIFDDRIFRELFEKDDPEGAEWLATLLDATERLFVELRGTVAAGEPAALAATAHRLAGVALSGGATRLGTICRAIETGAKNGEISDFAEPLAAAQAALDGAREAIVRYRSDRKEAAA